MTKNKGNYQLLLDNDEETENDHPIPLNNEQRIIIEDELSSDSQTDNETSGFPTSIYFIIGNEFCERFSFYGMKAILAIYLINWLKFSEDSATLIVHSFNFFAYFFSLIGGILADSLLGKYNTILYLSMVYCFGSFIVSAMSLPVFVDSKLILIGGTMFGLILLAIGTGGIKPCVSSFGGDQFHPSQMAQLSLYFSLFYFAVNAGSVLSMFVTPILRKDLHW